MNAVLTSKYIIDGVPQDLTPAQLLGCPSAEYSGTVIDESVDPPLESLSWDADSVDIYAEKISGTVRELPLSYSDVFTRCRMAEALLDSIWKEGHFCLGDLCLKASWKWNNAPVGAEAAFYESVRAAADYADSLDLEIATYEYETVEGCPDVSFDAVLKTAAYLSDEIEDSLRKIEMKAGRLFPETLQADPGSWLVYVPFDTSDYRLGGSLFSQAMNCGGGVSPQIQDADYFMDCYEVVRELVEDGIVLSGITVGEGGLMTAARKLCDGGPGTILDISDIMRAFEEPDIVKILFAEVPGVIIQIRDNDFDYIDAEFLLQDVAFYPLGHPNIKSLEVSVKASEKSGIQAILESLMQNAEGED